MIVCTYIYTCVYIYIYIDIYIYIYIIFGWHHLSSATYLDTKILDFRGFDSSIILIIRGGIPRPIGNFPESLTQAMLVGVMLVGILSVLV